MRALAVGALAVAGAITGCSLLVSTDGLKGGSSSKPNPTEGGTSGGLGDANATSSSSSGSASIPDADTDALIGATTSRYAKEVLADKPSIYLRFGDPRGATNVKNEVVPDYAARYSVDMELGTPGALAGDPDTAITFNGGVLELPPGVECDGEKECVVELWVRMEATSPDIVWVLDHEVYDPRSGWLLQTQDGYLTFERWAMGTGVGGAYSIDRVALSAWHHFVAVRDTSGFGVYVDGTPREHHPPSAPIPATNAKWTVGGNSCFDCGTRNDFKGSVDELAIYEHTIGVERINAHYAAGLGK